ncbi:MAG TPA: tyrosine-type recombinase/integrase [Gemmatales bacterium]|nr:tyrosine-type recombinase/integrase [Gemmatales bacterium]
MAKPCLPLFRKEKNAWYARINGRRVSLGVSGKDGKKEAYDAFYSMKANGIPERVTATTIQNIVDSFLQDGKERLSAGCYRNYRIFGDCLKAAFGDRRTEELTNAKIEAFTRKQCEWSNTYRNQFLGFIVTIYRWAMRERLIKVNPLGNVQRPPKASRGVQAVLTPEEHKALVSQADELFADFLELLWQTGARPSEIAGLTAAQVRQAVNGVIILSNHKGAYRGKQRMLILNDVAIAIVNRRADGRTGLLFDGWNGRLTANAIGGRIRRLAEKAGIRRVIAYGYRHTFATDALSKGVADASVAALLGHTSTTMLHKHYSHLTSRVAVLRGEMDRVR